MTMTSFSTAALAAMQSTQASAMMDICDLLSRFQTDRVDDYGQPVAEWVENETCECGLDLQASQEMINAEAHYYDARLRLPIDIDVSNLDRVRVTHRHGVMLASALLFDIIGDARRGPSGLVLDLREVA